MSHRVDFKSDITDAELLRKTLSRLRVTDYRVVNNVFSFTGGPYGGATIDLTTGAISGDADWIRGNLHLIHQIYSEEQVLDKIRLQGASVESRSVNEEGSIILMCRLHG